MRIRTVITAVTLMLLPIAGAQGADTEKFAIYYSDTMPADQFQPYQLVVLDSIRHPALLPLKEEGKIVLGYISLGELNQANPNFIAAKSHNLVLQENPNWQGSFYLDIRDPQWAKMVLEQIVPSILRQGFDGLFIDTLDSPLDLERANPGKYAGMSEAAAHLVEAIRMNYPSAKLMMNRAYAILPKVSHTIDMELGESVYANYDFAGKSYGKVEEAAYHQQVDQLLAAKKENPKLKIYTLDYADPSDHTDMKDIYRIERANGFIPYVTTIGLDRLVDEPSSH